MVLVARSGGVGGVVQFVLSRYYVRATESGSSGEQFMGDMIMIHERYLNISQSETWRY